MSGLLKHTLLFLFLIDEWEVNSSLRSMKRS